MMTTQNQMMATTSRPRDIIQDFAKSFFHAHKSDLEKFYPGISLETLLREFDYLCSLNGQLGEDYHARMESFFKSLLLGIPLAYLSQKRFFYNVDLFVSPDVLIPRQETELLVEMALEKIALKVKQQESLTIADIGTGSGAILLATLKEASLRYPKLAIASFASDISSRALEITKKNFFHNQYTLSPQIVTSFLLGDRLRPFQDKKIFCDLILSNPPYIMNPDDLSGVHSQVKLFEPELALFLKSDEYWEWYRQLIKDAFALLNPTGTFLMEGHEKHLHTLQQISLEIGFAYASIQNDLTGRERFLILQKSN
ncbi:MAG: peptide chain release factor N(5)-glutamine methyltransferase [Oligoflexia bacterium]|nr:peptide chain release factor N(5)-glutamine methyltransferase [Oligoflexia bacterium]MBF0366373.1 peptide chain release factor N(5)-glutamine methyltransferase [Oligoflexia bacterium]